MDCPDAFDSSESGSIALMVAVVAFSFGSWVQRRETIKWKARWESTVAYWSNKYAATDEGKREAAAYDPELGASALRWMRQSGK